ncbi:hypothetical protein M2323_001229 [Rhodoblastus acidophilus]|uniref:hypothetical protein n=1 Tax=Rhodoblastus acidophilus TaxID=1074 RepID=UPI0022249B9E|nr:hypothetical protein [Rhodoblastus acidophilus]MCW2283357.1 hypothetical protein [Rhodoblastus acidophilus]MCW2332319.1 hypothetical protein [Rhodoblastus acidophilus]
MRREIGPRQFGAAGAAMMAAPPLPNGRGAAPFAVITSAEIGGNEIMRDCGAAEFESSTRTALSDRFIVCAGGYPLSHQSTFAAAADQARVFVKFMPSSEISIYEVETGIHFDVPEKGLVARAPGETLTARSK